MAAAIFGIIKTKPKIVPIIGIPKYPKIKPMAKLIKKANKAKYQYSLRLARPLKSEKFLRAEIK